MDKITEKISKDRKEDSEQSAKAVSAIQSQDVFINETLRKFHTSILAKDKELNDLKIFFISEIKKVQGVHFHYIYFNDFHFSMLLV